VREVAEPAGVLPMQLGYPGALNSESDGSGQSKSLTTRARLRSPLRAPSARNPWCKKVTEEHFQRVRPSAVGSLLDSLKSLDVL
jgi:hypothetical protein